MLGLLLFVRVVLVVLMLLVCWFVCVAFASCSLFALLVFCVV